jgi:hypothetical protein
VSAAEDSLQLLQRRRGVGILLKELNRSGRFSSSPPPDEVADGPPSRHPVGD